MIRNNTLIALIVLSNVCFIGISAQNLTVTVEEAIQMAISNNKELESFRLKAEQSRKLKGEAFDPGSTNLYYSYDENNVAANDIPLKVFGIEQSFDFPGVYISRLKAARSQAEIDQIQYEIKKNEIAKTVTKNYYQVLYLREKLPLYGRLDSLYSSIVESARKRYTSGEISYLESLTIRSHAMQLRTNFIHTNEDLRNAQQKLQSIIQSDTLISIAPVQLLPLEISSDLTNTYGTRLYDEIQKLAHNRLKEQRNMLLPGLSLEYFQGTNNGENAKIYPGFSVGVSIPLFFGASRARIQSARIERQISDAGALNYHAVLKSQSEDILTEIRKYKEILNQYDVLGKETYEEILRYSDEAYEKGDIDFHIYITSLEEAINLQLSYLENLNEYNQSVIELNYLDLEL